MRGSGARALLPVLGMLALIGVVAMAATGSTPAGASQSRRPADVVFDTLFTLFLVLLALGAAVYVYALLHRKEIAQRISSGRYKRAPLVVQLAVFLVFLLLAYLARRYLDLRPGEDDSPIVNPDPANPFSDSSEDGGAEPYRPELAWLPALVVLSVAAAAALAYAAANRRSPRLRDPNVPLTEEVAVVIEDTLDDLRAEPDPRRAVIAAYARLERVFQVHGLPRRASETPEEFLARVLRSLDVGEQAARTLTDLFEVAKFSQHRVDAEMKEQAIAALEDVRDELLTDTADEPTPPRPPLSSRPA